MKRFLLLARGRMRIWLGFCPACNSDAPAVDNCEICGGYDSRMRFEEWPPSPGRRLRWWREFKRTLPIVLAVALCGCATIKPARFTVRGIPEAVAASSAQQQAIGKAAKSSKLTAAEISKIKTLANRSEGKTSVILQWLDRQERRAHERP